MTTPFWCLLIACLLPIAASWVCGYYRSKELGTVDNKQPRDQYAQLTGAGARAVAAQQNAWEALPIFASAVFVSHLTGVDAGTAATLSITFIVARVAHLLLYLANRDALRSLAFLVGLGCCIALFVMG